MLTFLHLSDLHFTTEDACTQFDRDKKIREALLADLGKDGRSNFDAILVTGDIVYHGRADEFARAKAWLEEVRTTTGSSPEALFVVPGNHDVNRDVISKDSSLWELHQSLRKMTNTEDRTESLNKKLHDPFDFLTALNEYREFSKEYGCPTNPNELAWVQVLAEKRLLEDGTSVRFHGLNSALISDGDDQKANLLLSPVQFHHFSSDPNYVNVVLCHHPHTWLIDGNNANDFFRQQADVILCGHEHATRYYLEGRSLRVFAGAVHPSRREDFWEPCYHVLRFAISTAVGRQLIVNIETRVWRERDKCFGPYVQADGSPRSEEHVELQVRGDPSSSVSANSASESAGSMLASPEVKAVADAAISDSFAAARRKLIVHFFRLGTLARYQAVMTAGVWEDGDDSLDGQARWARIFDRAEKRGKFGALWDAVAGQDKSLSGQPNPFDNQA